MILGEFIRARRIHQQRGLRSFCLSIQIDPSLWSKVEQHEAYLTDPEVYLPRIADLLSLDPGHLNKLYQESIAIPLKVDGEPLPEGALKAPKETTLQAMQDAMNQTNLTRLNSVDELFK